MPGRASSRPLAQAKVALLDFNLPDYNGLLLAEAILKLLPQAAILMMSGRIDGLPEKTLEELGITVFVNKPLPLGPLRKAVIKLVQDGPRAGQGNSGWLAAGYGSPKS